LSTNAPVSPSVASTTPPTAVTTTIEPVSVIELSAIAERTSSTGTASLSPTLYAGLATTRSRELNRIQT
jgi:hypothetical protein